MQTLFHWLLSLLGPFGDIVEALAQRLGRLIGLLLFPFFVVAAAIARFLGRWWNSRQRQWLIQGMPAFLTAIVVAATSLAAWLPTRRDLANRYLDLAIVTSDEGDTAPAALYIEKAARAWNKSPSTEFRRALVLEKVGRQAEGHQLLLELAPVDKVGHIPAHELLVDRLSQRTDDPKAWELVRVHCDLILSENPDHARVHRLLAVKAIQEKNLDQALQHLAIAVRRFPRLRLPYAQLLRVAGREDEFLRQAEALVTFFEPIFADDGIKLMKQESTVTVEDRVAYSAILSMLKRFEQAIAIARAGQNVPDEPLLRSALASAYLIWSDTFDSESMVSLTEKMICLDAALKLAPNSREILYRVAKISTLTGQPAELANERLRKMLANGTAPAIIHFILGTSAAEANDTEKALFHLEQASRINPNVPVTLNNLAWVIAHEPNIENNRPRLEQAKRLIDKALKFKPTNPQFRETNGQILLRLEEWQDAITEFEYALRYLKGARPTIHQALALAYGKMGHVAMSRVHRDLVGVITETPDSNDALLTGDARSQMDSPPIVSDNNADQAVAGSTSASPGNKPELKLNPSITNGSATDTKKTPAPDPAATSNVEELPPPPGEPRTRIVVEELPAPDDVN